VHYWGECPGTRPSIQMSCAAVVADHAVGRSRVLPLVVLAPRTTEAVMTAPRIATRRLAALLCLSACHSWQPVPLTPDTNFGHDARVRVELADQSRDSTASSGNGSSTSGPQRVVFHLPEIVGDSLRGWQSERVHSTVAIADVRHPEQYRFSSGRTTALAVTGVAVVALGVALIASMNNMKYDLSGVSLLVRR